MSTTECELEEQQKDHGTRLRDAGQDSRPIRKMRAVLHENAKYIKELERLVSDGEVAIRKLAFIEAGVDTSTPLGKLFAKAYDGELDPEVVNTAAKEAGVIAVPDEKPASETLSEEERAAHEGPYGDEPRDTDG